MLQAAVAVAVTVSVAMVVAVCMRMSVCMAVAMFLYGKGVTMPVLLDGMAVIVIVSLGDIAAAIVVAGARHGGTAGAGLAP